MKKVWSIVLFGTLLFLFACSKEQQVPETDLIFEGKTYVVGSGKPPKGKPMKMLIYQSEMNQGMKFYEVIDSFYTDASGQFSFRFQPKLKPNRYLIKPVVLWGYDNLDQLKPNKLGKQLMNFRILANGSLKLRLKNNNYQWGDSLVMIDQSNTASIFSAPIAYDIILDLHYPAFVKLNFEFRLRRNENWTIWKEVYFLHDDSTHYHEVIY